MHAGELHDGLVGWPLPISVFCPAIRLVYCTVIGFKYHSSCSITPSSQFNSLHYWWDCFHPFLCKIKLTEHWQNLVCVPTWNKSQKINETKQKSAIPKCFLKELSPDLQVSPGQANNTWRRRGQIPYSFSLFRITAYLLWIHSMSTHVSIRWCPSFLTVDFILWDAWPTLGHSNDTADSSLHTHSLSSTKRARERAKVRDGGIVFKPNVLVLKKALICVTVWQFCYMHDANVISEFIAILQIVRFTLGQNGFLQWRDEQ